MANTTPIVNTVTKPVTNPREVDATPGVNIQDFCEEYYKDILHIIMDKVRRDKRKEVHTRLDFEEDSKERKTREGSHYSSTRALTARPERLKVRDRLRYSDRHVLDRLGRTSFRDHSRGRSRPHRLDASNEGRPENRERFRGVSYSYDDSHSSHSYRDRDRSRHVKRRRDSESLLSSVSKSDSSDGRGPEDHVKIFQAAAQVERWAMPTWCRMFNSTLIGAARLWFDELPSESIDSYKDLKAVFLAYFMEQKKKTLEKRSDFRGQPKKGRGSSRFTSLTRTPKEILAAEVGKFQPPPPTVTPVEKRSSNKFCKLSHLTKEIKHGRDQSKVGKKETPAKDKTTAIYMIKSWQRMTRQKVTQSFKRVREIMFSPLATSGGAKGPLVIEAKIGGHMIHCMYVDGGSSMEILYEHCFNRLRPEVKNQMVPATTSLIGFSRETIWPLGQLKLLVTIDVDHFTRAMMNFMIVRSLSPYNGIIRRPGIKEIQIVPSTAYGMLKFLADGGIVTIRSTILIPAQCATMITSSEVPKEAGVRHKKIKVALDPNFPDQEVAIGGTLSPKGRTELCSLLKENLDIFAWQPSNMTGVPRSVAEHRLNIREGYSPVRKKKRGQASERAKAIQADV
nr:reverse transcriptase domain-containing protein [Tanacetum cinerariifolium]